MPTSKRWSPTFVPSRSSRATFCRKVLFAAVPCGVRAMESMSILFFKIDNHSVVLR